MSVKISSLNTASTIDSGDDISIAGNNPLTFSDWGGGWFMQDGTYIRSLNQKSIWLGDGVLASQGGLSVGYGGTLPTAGYGIIAGNLGVGTNAPTAQLSINESNFGNIAGRTAAIYAAADSETIFSIGRKGSGADYTQFLDFGVNQSGLYSTISARQYTTTENKLILQPNGGYVGIGTTTPSSKLHISGVNTLLTITDTTYGRTSEIGYLDYANLYFANDGASNTYIGRYNNVFLAYGGGSVGIGTTTPATKLDVNGSINLSDGNNLTWGGAYGAGIPTIAAVISGGIYFYPAGSTSGDSMRITSNGSVWVGNTVDYGARFSVKQPASGNAANFSNGSDADLNIEITATGAATKYAKLTPSVGIPLVLSLTTGSNVLIGITSDPGYKLYVNGTGLFNGVVNSYATMDNLARRINSPEGASYVTSSGSVTGAIKIKLPIARNNSSTMMMFTVKIYQYNTGNSHEFRIGGYNYGLGDWYNVFATNLTDNGANFDIKFGTDGTSDCVWIGETSSTWSYPQVFVTDFQAGYSGQGIAWATGWAISFETAFNTVELTRLASQVITSRNISSQSVAFAANAGTLGTYAETSFIRIAVNSSLPTNANFAMGQASSRNFIQSHSGQPLDLNPLGNAVTINGYTPITSNNIGSQSVAYATDSGNANSIDGWGFVNTGSNSQTSPDTIDSNGISYTGISLLGQSDGALYSQAYSTAWQHQVFGDYRTGQIAVRGKNSGVWQAWRTVLDSSNYNSYAPSLIGTGASGTWAINVTGTSYSSTNTSNIVVNSLGTGSVNVNNGNTAVYRNENGNGGNIPYAPILHVAASDTMWQIQGTYGTTGNGTLYFRQGYSGSWGNWLTMISSANIGSQSVSYATTAGALTSMNISQFTNDSGYITSGALAGYLPLAGGTSYPLTGTLYGVGASFSSGVTASTLGATSVSSSTGFIATAAGGGLRNDFYDVRFYPSAGNIWNITGATLGGSSFALRFLDAYNAGSGAVKAQIFWSASNVGLFNDQNDWVIKANQGSSFGGTLYGSWAITGTVNAKAGSYINGAANSDWAFQVENTGTTSANGLYVNLGVSATGVPFRVDKNGSPLFDLTNAGNATIKGALTISGSNLYINSSAADISSRYNNGTNNYGWLLSTTSKFILFDYNSEVGYMQIDPISTSSSFYYANFTINTSNTSGGSIAFKAALAANTWSINKNDTTGLSINKNGVAQLGISATGATTLINTLSVTGGYIEVGAYGLSSSTYSAYIRRNDTSSYGAWDITGGKGAYTGALYNTTNQPHIMFGTTNGFGGLYYQTGSRWVLYYNYTDNSLAVGGTTTSATYKLYVTGAIFATGAIVANSDGRIKENIEVVGNALDKVNNLRGVTYTKKNEDTGKREMGVIAQEVLPHVPEVVQYAEDLDQYGVSYGNFAGLFIEAIKEQQVLIKELQAEIEILKNK